MEKTGLKTFVCSFAFSLLAFVSAGKEWLTVPSNKSQEIIIPSKNISLFFNDIENNTPSTKTLPIKKIALSVPTPRIQEKKSETNKENLLNSDLIPLTFEEEEDEIEFDIEDINLLAQKDKKNVNSDTTTQIKEQKIAQNFDAFIEQKPQIHTAKEESSTLSEVKDNEIEPFTSKVLQAQVRVIQPNKKNVNKLRETDKTQEAPLSSAKENEIIPIQQASSSNISPQKEEESHVIALVPDNELSSPQESFSEAKQAEISSDKILPTFKVAEAKQNPDIPLLSSSQIGKKENSPKNLLIPIEKDDTISNGSDNIVTSVPEKEKLAMLTGKTSITSMEKQSSASKGENTPATSDWETMASKNKNKETWAVAKGAGHIANSKLKDENYYKSEGEIPLSETLRNKGSSKQKSKSIKLAAETVDNLLIPIPEELLNDPDLTPQLVSSEQNKELEKKLLEKENFQEKKETIPPLKVTEKAKEEEKSGLLQSLTSIFTKGDNPNSSQDKKDIFDKFRFNKSKSEGKGKILPTEIRLAFQANRAEISGTTLKWLQAFANKTIEDKNVGLEIRIDGSSSYELQQKRLNLLNNILASNGVDFQKINTVFTTREPNSFIIRTIRINNEKEGEKENNDWQDYYKIW